MNYEISMDSLEGPYGRAIRLQLPDRPDAAETVCSWIITAPMWHPAWSQYNLFVVRLRHGVPGFAEPKLQFEGATHELLVVALNPEKGPYTRKRIIELDWTVPWLSPLNIVEQFEATDQEMDLLAGYCALGVVNGVLCPETADAPERIREAWLTSMVRTLAHMRGEPHAEQPTARPPRKPYRDPAPGEDIVTAISPGITNDKRSDVEAMMRQTHDGLITMLGDRRRSGIRWHQVRGALACHEWLDKYVADTEPERRDAVNSMADQYRAFIDQVGDVAVLVIAACDAVR